MTEFRFFSQIWPISPVFEPICQELGHFAWIWAILLGFGPQRRRSPEDGAGGGPTDVRTDGQIPPVFYRTSSPSGPLPKNDFSGLEFALSDLKICPLKPQIRPLKLMA